MEREREIERYFSIYLFIYFILLGDLAFLQYQCCKLSYIDCVCFHIPSVKDIKNKCGFILFTQINTVLLEIKKYIYFYFYLLPCAGTSKQKLKSYLLHNIFSYNILMAIQNFLQNFKIYYSVGLIERPFFDTYKCCCVCNTNI